MAFAREHGLKALSAFVVFIATSGWGLFWAWRSWRSRSDLDVFHLSQNGFRNRPTGPDGSPEPWLILDVIFEDLLTEIVSHPMPRRLIRAAAKQTTESRPFLKFDEADRWYVLNIIRLAIAETCAVSTLAKMSTQSRVDEIECLFALTYERYPGMRQGKIRAMLVPKALLDDDKALYRDNIRFESDTHVHRVTTLRKMQDDYRSGKPEYCMDVRLNVLV
ncbi:MAG: hypothetical protein K8U03_09430 [Planctomycetia bacterium]|nr:hypothetical protein [Planctomycetia bacterium]